MEIGTSAYLLIGIVILDALIGDPVYKFHPIRIMGSSILTIETFLRKRIANERFAGVFLVILMLIIFVGLIAGVSYALQYQGWTIAWWVWNLYWGFSCLALRDLLKHVHRIGKAVEQGKLEDARKFSSYIVGRDTHTMDGGACIRSGLESLSENLTDGVLSPIFWFALGGVPGMVFFKVASTLDSTVGYKNQRYLYFGWAGARLDDLMNWIPARLTWLCTAFTAFLLPGFSGIKAFKIGWQQYKLIPSPNSGWSEASFAGALQMRLAGPIWNQGVLVNTLWLGLDTDPPAQNYRDMQKGLFLATAISFIFIIIAFSLLILINYV
ncbi:MAG: cobalamin biosynthesis protein CobD [Fibrobacter sp.]|nr:cobalamin biosynthesis protein CobD [Fibrobacter sp.]